MNKLNLLGRKVELFTSDINKHEKNLHEIISKSKFLVLGGAGSIGQSVVKELFKRKPLKLHVVDISEHKLVELVRDLRSSLGYIEGQFRTFALDIASKEYDAFIDLDGEYDYVLNLSALKHVRSEKDQFTLMRMVNVNIINTIKTIEQSISNNVKKYFCVSTDKAANPVNMMGASKRIMEMFLMKYSDRINISTARFANVAFSDGSLLYSFRNRIEKKQPLVAPNDVRRYFVTFQEAGELCLMSCIFGNTREIYFPKLLPERHMTRFDLIALKYLSYIGYKPFMCKSEDEARKMMKKMLPLKKWPCYFSKSNTSGEKLYEEFYTEHDDIDIKCFEDIGIIKSNQNTNYVKLENFKSRIHALLSSKKWNKNDILIEFNKILPNFTHKEKGKNLDEKM